MAILYTSGSLSRNGKYPHITSCAIGLIQEPTCDLLIKRDLRSVFPDDHDAQQLLALRLQVPHHDGTGAPVAGHITWGH